MSGVRGKVFRAIVPSVIVAIIMSIAGSRQPATGREKARMSNPRTQYGGSIVILCSAFVWMVMSFVGTAPATANPEVKLEWIWKGEEEISPPSTSVTVTEADIQAEIELVLQISLVLDEIAIHEFGFLVIFDDDERDELDFYDGAGPQAPISYGLFNSIAIGDFAVFESDDGKDGWGEIGPYRGCVEGSVCDFPKTEDGVPVGNLTLVIDTVSFRPTATASNDRWDIFIEEVPFNEEFRDANGDVIDHSDITFGHAAVVPEPTSAALTASALLTLAALARTRSRSVA